MTKPLDRPPIIAIAAVDARLGLAKGGALPWHVPSDLRRFKRLTVGDGDNAVLLGRLTWDSLEPKYRPLSKRRNIVLTRRPFDHAGVSCVGTWDEGIEAARGAKTLWIVGGAQIYAQAFELGLTDAVELTRISGDHGCDLFFPNIPVDFRLVQSESRTDGGLTIVDERWERAAV